jgi:hypothetical protein
MKAVFLCAVRAEAEETVEDLSINIDHDLM